MEILSGRGDSVLFARYTGEDSVLVNKKSGGILSGGGGGGGVLSWGGGGFCPTLSHHDC